MTTESSSGKPVFATLFPITGHQNLKFDLRVLQVRERLPQDSKRAERLNQVASDLWRRVIKSPCKPYRINENPSFLIPAEKAKDAEGYTFIGPANREYHLDLTDEAITVNMQEADLSRRDIVCDLLARSFTDKFVSLRQKYWRWNWSLFYRALPENYGESKRLVDAFRGIRFSVIWLDNAGPHLAADIRTKYLGKHSLLDYLSAGDTNLISDHLKIHSRKDARSACFVRDNRTVRYSCIYAGDSDETVSNYSFSIGDKKTTVLEYYATRFGIRLPSEDKVVYVKDNEHRDPIPVPASRLFPAFDTDQIKEMHKGLSIEKPPSAQLSPQQRIALLTAFLGDIRQLSLSGTTMTLNLEPLSRAQRYFTPPNLLYGNGYVLRFGENSSPPDWHNHERLMGDWIKTKAYALPRNGVFSCPALPRFYLWMPSQWNRSLRDNVEHFLGDELKRVSKQEHLTLRTRVYESSHKLMDALKQTQHENAISIVGLASQTPSSTYTRLKQLANIKTQCFSQATAYRIHETGFHRNLALATLIDGGVKPWVLDTKLNYDVYVGIDVLQNRAAFHFFWGQGARNMHFWPGQSVSQARHQEAIKPPHMFKNLCQGLEHIYSETKMPINSITIHRDGRWWPSEQIGLENAISSLKGRGVLADSPRIAVVEIRKTHMPVRLLSQKVQRGVSFFCNPVPGIHWILNRNQILLACTWNPVSPDTENGRTSGTLLINVAHSLPAHDILEIARDIFDLTQLNWTAPGIEINVPVTIRWADHRLREELFRLAETEEDDLGLSDDNPSSLEGDD